MPPAAITVDSLGKAYRIGLKEEVPDTLVGAATGWLKTPLRNLDLRRLNTFTANHDDQPDLIWALRDVSFEVPEGEVLGVIGRNGAGKSTLLKILSRITEPTRGRAVIHGRVSSLLEVGTGFHQELSGRENIYMNGTILGMRKREIDRKLEQIIDFSGVERFLDTPIKRYSSGMKVRLAFAVAAHLEPEILIIDEVLAVGDAEFQKKCLGKMQDVATGGRTVLFVSHNMAAVESLCLRVVEMNQGTVQAIGETAEVISHYRKNAFRSTVEAADKPFMSSQWIKKADLVGEDGLPTSFVLLGGELHIRMEVNPVRPVRHPQIGIGIDAMGGQRMLTVHTPLSHDALGAIDRAAVIHCKIASLPLAPGEYSLKIALSEIREQLEAVEDVVPFTVANAETFGDGRGANGASASRQARGGRLRARMRIKPLSLRNALALAAFLIAISIALFVLGGVFESARYLLASGAATSLTVSLLVPLLSIYRLQTSLSHRINSIAREATRSATLSISTELHAMNVLLRRFPQCDFSTTSYTIRFSNLLAIVELLDKQQPEHIVELGSGLSTICIASWIKERGKGRLTTYDHDVAWAQSTLRQLDRHELREHVELVVTPLTIHAISGLPWYDLHEHAKQLDRVDFLLVDGPPAGNGQTNLTRLPAVDAFTPVLAKSATIVLDDASRQGEKEVIRLWSANLPSHSLTSVHSISGLAILSHSMADSEMPASTCTTLSWKPKCYE